MTQVDFYILNEPGLLSSLTTACRIVEKAWRRRHAVYIHTGDAQTAQALDELLWTFRPNSFIPHRIEGSEPPVSDKTPDILIGCGDNPGQHDDVLVNLAEDTPAFFGRFSRVAEIVRGEEDAKARSRERYKYYRKRGYPLQVHPL